MLAYAPNTIDIFGNIMQTAIEQHLNNITYVSFETCNELRQVMHKKCFLAGICFNETHIKLEEEKRHLIHNYPCRLEYSLIFPNEQRIYNDTFLGANWATTYNYDGLMPPKQRNVRKILFSLLCVVFFFLT